MRTPFPLCAHYLLYSLCLQPECPNQIQRINFKPRLRLGEVQFGVRRMADLSGHGCHNGDTRYWNVYWLWNHPPDFKRG